MKSIIKSIAVFAMLLMVGLTSSFAQEGGQSKKDKEIKNQTEEKSNKERTDSTIYTCTMHPEIKLDRPGKCPKCGMELVIQKNIKSKEKVCYCPMHPAVTSDMQGKCPKCGSDMVKKK